MKTLIVNVYGSYLSVCVLNHTQIIVIIVYKLLCDYSTRKGATDWQIKHLFVFHTVTEM